MDTITKTPRAQNMLRHAGVSSIKIRTNGGFTLLELLIAVAIMAIVFGFGIPSLRGITATNRLAAGVNAISGSLAYARSEAIRQNQHVVVCQSENGRTCRRNGDWREGWLVFVDRNRNRQVDGDETILQHHTGIPSRLGVVYRAFGSKHYLAYRPSGATKTNGTFTICDQSDNHYARAVILIKSGRVRISKRKPDGTPLDCSG